MTEETTGVLPVVSYLFLTGALHLEAQRQLTECRDGHGAGDLGDLTISSSNTDFLVPESHGNYPGEERRKKEKKREEEEVGSGNTKTKGSDEEMNEKEMTCKNITGRGAMTDQTE